MKHPRAPFCAGLMFCVTEVNSKYLTDRGYTLRRKTRKTELLEQTETQVVTLL